MCKVGYHYYSRSRPLPMKFFPNHVIRSDSRGIPVTCGIPEKMSTSRIMSVMILVGGLDRLATVLTTSYDNFTDGSRSQFQDLDSRIG